MWIGVKKKTHTHGGDTNAKKEIKIHTVWETSVSIAAVAQFIQRKR